MDCIFCKILKGDIPCNKVFEDDSFIAILDAFPGNEGHVLIIPKSHYENIFDIDEQTLKNAYGLAKKVAFALKSSLGAEDINILQNNGELAGQTVNHFHIHVLPRYKDDKVIIKSEPVEIEKNKIEQIRQNIEKNINI